jgi:hypothetical protein
MSNKDKEPQETPEVEEKKFVSTDDLISKWYSKPTRNNTVKWTGD